MLKQYISIVFSVVLLQWLAISNIDAAPHIASTDHTAAPVGETITFTGSGFTGTTAVTFFWARSKNAATFSVINDSTLAVTVPNFTQGFRERFVLIETATGSTVSLAPGGYGDVTEFTGIGPVPEDASPYIIIKAGAVATSLPEFFPYFVYVESGAVLQNVPSEFFGGFIFAENGATLDFRGSNFTNSVQRPAVFYSPSTTILGSLPPNSGSFGNFPPRRVAALSNSPGVGPFSVGVRVNVTIVGDGSVEMDPDTTYLAQGTSFTLTATPGAGSIFQSWSGASSSSSPVVELVTDFNNTNINITATFSSGQILETFAGSGGTIEASPDLAVYTTGQSVVLNAIPKPGYTFVGWGGALAGQVSSPANLTMNAHKTVSAIFLPVTPAVQPHITSTDHTAAPVGETITFTGSGFTGTTAVTFFWASTKNAATFSVIDDSTLAVTVPNFTQGFRERFVLIETATGSTVSLAPGSYGDVTEFPGYGPVPQDASPYIVIKAGAVATSLPDFGPYFVYVESGAVLQNIPSEFFGGFIFAENGATLDFRGTNFTNSVQRPAVFYSPGTTILGSLPPVSGSFGNIPSRQVASLSNSPGVGPFSVGVGLNVTIVGNGSVEMNPDTTYLAQGTSFTLTATPAAGSVFQSWSGASNSSSPVVELVTDYNNTNINITATFSSGQILETFAGSGGTIEASPDLAAYSTGQSVVLSAIPKPGYTFVGWGGALAGQVSSPANLTMNAHKTVSAIFLPVTPVVQPHITSTDHTAAPVGETIRFTGSGFTGTTAVTFFWAGTKNAATFSVIDDSTLAVTVPNFTQGFRERFVLIETATGSTVSLAPGGYGDVTEFTGYGPVSQDASPYIIIKAGAVATSLPEFFPYFVYVESGAVLQNVPSEFFGVFIFAENGATLDFRGTNFTKSVQRPAVFYSPGTTILGSLPPFSGSFGSIPPRQVASLSSSPGVGPFSVGYPFTLLVDGPGSVSINPMLEYYPEGTAITLTATPAPDNYFVRWMGAISSSTGTKVFVIKKASEVTARFSDHPDFFSDWRARFFTPAQLADPGITGPDKDPDRDQITNAAEYAFGTNPVEFNGNRGFKILPGGNPHQEGVGLRLEYIRPKYAADINYILQASEGINGGWTVGTIGNLIFTVTEEKIVPQGDDMEKITLRVAFPDRIPNSLFFQLTANLEDF